MLPRPITATRIAVSCSSRSDPLSAKHVTPVFRDRRSPVLRTARSPRPLKTRPRRRTGENVRRTARVRRAHCVTICRMGTLTIRTDAEVERALESLTRDGQSRSEATRAAILEAERTHRRARLRAEAEQLRNDPDDVAASRELAAEMDAIRAW